MRKMCLKPVWVASQSIWADCGHCRACRAKRRHIWTLRLTHESAEYGHKALLVTLTYNNEHLPQGFYSRPTLYKRHLQLFFKRLRKNLGGSGVFKYYACGEYGAKTQRPHYHIVFLGLDMTHADLIFKTWGMCDSQGYNVSQIRGAGAYAYAAGYVAKKLGVHYNANSFEFLGIEPEFQLQSIGIGKRFALRDPYMKKNGYLRIKGKKVIPPRYYRKLLNLTADRYLGDITRLEYETLAWMSRLHKREYIVSREISRIPSRYYYGGHIVTQQFYDDLYHSRRYVDEYLKSQFERSARDANL